MKKILALLLGAQAAPALASDGVQFALPWAIPFAGLLLSIALCPLLLSSVWQRHYGKIAAAWSLAVLLPALAVFGAGPTARVVGHTLLLEYVPFILVLFALFTVAGGICVRGNLRGTPATNTALLAIGTVLAGWMGTTGASMLMIRPVIRANDDRKHAAHVIVFFIFLVANAGGALTPLGDPPLFLGFLKGVDFFWPTRHLFLPAVVLACVLLLAFYLIDSRYWRRHDAERLGGPDPTPDQPIRIEGWVNMLLLAAIVGAVLMSGTWQPGVRWMPFEGAEIELQNVVRDVLLVAIALLSLKLTPATAREGNHFEWGPIVEVAKLFLAIFVTIVPVIVMLRAGTEGPFGGLVRLVTDDAGAPINAMFFWMSGALSSFLDNAPTYLVFFNMAGGDAQALMTQHAATLAAISAGSVFMGAMTYIGNAPNFMVKAVAEQRGIAMPSFLRYMAWSGAILLPSFVLLTFIFFR